jgi:myo-inositol catabolism protein IolC
MTSQAINMVNQMKHMSDFEIDYLWDFLRKRRNESLLSVIDMKLEESMNSDSLTNDEVTERLKKLGIA